MVTAASGMRSVFSVKPPSTLWCSDVMKETVLGLVQAELVRACSKTTALSARASSSGVVGRP